MSRRKIYFYCSLILALSSLALLVTGSTLLTKALDGQGKVPLGTLTTWIGLIALPLTVYWGIGELRGPTSKLNRILSGFLKVTISLAFLWVPIAFLLAGNLSFSFSEKESFQGGQTAMKLFWNLSYGIGLGTLLTLLVYWISKPLKKNKTVANNGDDS